MAVSTIPSAAPIAVVKDSRSQRSRGAVSAFSATASSSARAIPIAPATFSVPARR